ncbi:MAG: helix-turn-helix transcriptional regulator [Bdellovibrionaceae bacterium]|jgi:transcriptional regulator with XRE-family HTH domain|nr:helix-turn-helix transcriptional regulator [Pseudobdellovibrionaceae bacterium]
MKPNIVLKKKWRAQLNQGVKDGSIDLPDALKLLRKIIGKSQLEYSQLVGVSKKVISDFEVKKGNPTVVTLNKIFAPIGLQVGLVSKRR